MGEGQEKVKLPVQSSGQLLRGVKKLEWQVDRWTTLDVLSMWMFSAITATDDVVLN